MAVEETQPRLLDKVLWTNCVEGDTVFSNSSSSHSRPNDYGRAMLRLEVNIVPYLKALGGVRSPVAEREVAPTASNTVFSIAQNLHSGHGIDETAWSANQRKIHSKLQDLGIPLTLVDGRDGKV